MKYGLIGEKLSHSFSKPIHERIADYSYEIKEIPKQELDLFMKQKAFVGINVTIPYKSDVIPYLDYIDPIAEKIGAVNTIVNRDGKLTANDARLILRVAAQLDEPFDSAEESHSELTTEPASTTDAKQATDIAGVISVSDGIYHDLRCNIILPGDDEIFALPMSEAEKKGYTKCNICLK